LADAAAAAVEGGIKPPEPRAARKFELTPEILDVFEAHKKINAERKETLKAIAMAFEATKTKFEEFKNAAAAAELTRKPVAELVGQLNESMEYTRFLVERADAVLESIDKTLSDPSETNYRGIYYATSNYGEEAVDRLAGRAERADENVEELLRISPGLAAGHTDPHAALEAALSDWDGTADLMKDLTAKHASAGWRDSAADEFIVVESLFADANDKVAAAREQIRQQAAGSNDDPSTAIHHATEAVALFKKILKDVYYTKMADDEMQGLFDLHRKPTVVKLQPEDPTEAADSGRASVVEMLPEAELPDMDAPPRTDRAAAAASDEEREEANLEIAENWNLVGAAGAKLDATQKIYDALDSDNPVILEIGTKLRRAIHNFKTSSSFFPSPLSDHASYSRAALDRWVAKSKTIAEEVTDAVNDAATAMEGGVSATE
jgi:hypothetical protein